MIAVKKQNKKTIGVALADQELEMLEDLKSHLGMSSSVIARLGLKALRWAYYNDHLGNILSEGLTQLNPNTGRSLWDAVKIVNFGERGEFKTVQIGIQTWLAEDYHVDGEDRFSWEATQSSDFCPDGWRMPTVADFEELTKYAQTHSCLGIDWMAGLCEDQDEWGFNAGLANEYNYFWTSDRAEPNSQFAKVFLIKGDMTAIDDSYIYDAINKVRLIKCSQ